MAIRRGLIAAQFEGCSADHEPQSPPKARRRLRGESHTPPPVAPPPRLAPGW